MSKNKGRNLAEIVMNPIRQRIVQYLLIHEKGTTGEMREELSDIPPASLYRHVKILLEADCIEVVEERKIRGTIERTYKLVPNPMGAEMSQEEVGLMIQTSLMSIMSTFQTYFAKEGVDPQKDFLSLSTSTLLLTDEEYMDFLKKLGNVFNDVVMNKPKEGRKQRRITFISSPCEE